MTSRKKGPDKKAVRTAEATTAILARTIRVQKKERAAKVWLYLLVQRARRFLARATFRSLRKVIFRHH